ncbi:MAG: SdpI family protein [Phycisphaerae bacterium]|nr:SdpI family protein [Phycisphaerae bacterium]
MNRKITLFLILVIVLAALVISLLAYPKLPDRMASHWNGRGEVDGWMSKSVCLWLMPGIMVIQTIIFFSILLIDPLRKNIAKFFGYYAGFVIILNLFLLAVHGWMILWNLGIQIPSNVFMPVGIACLIFYAGIIMTHVKPNWFIGIRTPWTLSNEIVWQKTNKLGGLLFRIAAIIILIGAAFPKYAIVFVLAPVLSVALITLIYSFVIWKKLKTD